MSQFYFSYLSNFENANRCVRAWASLLCGAHWLLLCWALGNLIILEYLYSHSLWKPSYSAFRFKPETNTALNKNRLEDSTFLITFLFGMAGKCATPPFSPSIKGEKMVRPGHSRTLPRPGFWILRLARHLWWQRQASDHYPATEGAVRVLSLLDFFEFVMKVLRCWHCMMFVHKIA